MSETTPSARMTELEAVSEIMEAAGLMPVSSVSSPNSVSARNHLRREWAKVLTAGWWFNERTDYEVDVADDGTVTLPAEVIDLDENDDEPQQDNLIIVDGKLYSKVDGSGDFSGQDTVSLAVVISVAFEESPRVVQDYAVAAAAYKFVRNRMGDVRKAREMRDDVALAYAELHRADLNRRDLSLMRNRNLSMHTRLPRVGLHSR